MRLTIIVIPALLSLSACGSDQERMHKAMEKQIRTTIQSDWHYGIPLDDLIDSMQTCQKHPELSRCDIVESQIKDIAASVATCKVDQRSLLCRALASAIDKHSVIAMLPKADALQLPDDPWFWNLPTAALEAQSSKYGYREETIKWWWLKWRLLILSCTALLSGMYAAWNWWSKLKTARKERAATIVSQRAARIEQDKIRRIREEQARVEAEHQAKLARDAAKAEQQRLTAENHAQQQAAEVAAKLAAEQAEAAMLLSAAFKPTSKPKRKKNAPSSI